jgi:hypothetical protein
MIVLEYFDIWIIFTNSLESNKVCRTIKLGNQPTMTFVLISLYSH